MIPPELFASISAPTLSSSHAAVFCTTLSTEVANSHLMLEQLLGRTVPPQKSLSLSCIEDTGLQVCAELFNFLTTFELRSSHHVVNLVASISEVSHFLFQMEVDCTAHLRTRTAAQFPMTLV